MQRTVMFIKTTTIPPPNETHPDETARARSWASNGPRVEIQQEIDASPRPAMNQPMRPHSRTLRTSIVFTVLLLNTTIFAQSPESSALAPRTGRAIQGDSPLPLQTRRGRCNPADTRCQLPRHRVQPKDSDLNEQTESGRRLNRESSLNDYTRTGPSLNNPATK